MARAAAVGRPDLSTSFSFAGRAGGTCASSRSNSASYSALVRSESSSRPASSLATLARTLLGPAGSSDTTTARPLNISQNRSLPTAVSMLPPCLRLPQLAGVRQRRQRCGARPGTRCRGIAGYLLLWIGAGGRATDTRAAIVAIRVWRNYDNADGLGLGI